MKPTNNRVYCIGCRHLKMLFESQAKADNFIKFNRDEIASSSDKAPSRSYYCSFCCGWHVTSVEDEDKAEANDKRDERTWHQIMSLRRKKLPLTSEGRELSEMIVSVHTLIQKCLSQLFSTNLSDALELYKDIVLELSIVEDRAKRQNIVSTRIDRIKFKVKALQKTFDIIDEYDIDSYTRNLFLGREGITTDESAAIYMRNKEFITTVNDLLSKLDHAKNSSDLDEYNRLSGEVSHTISNYKGKGLSAKKKELSDRFTELQKKSPTNISQKKAKDNNNSVYMSIIEILEQAYQAIGQSDFRRCNNLIKTAECLMPDSSDEISKALWNQIQALKDQTSE